MLSSTAGGSSLGLHANGEVYHNGKMISKFDGKFEPPAKNPKTPSSVGKGKRDKEMKGKKTNAPPKGLMTARPEGSKLWHKGCTVSCTFDSGKDGGLLSFQARILPPC